MSKVVGIDVRPTHVRAVLLRQAYRKTFLEELREVELADFETTVEAIRACVSGFNQSGTQRVDGFGVALDGAKTFVHPLSIPVTAEKQLAELLPFELEALVPVDLDDLVFDRDIAPRKASDTTLQILTVAARREDVEKRIAVVEEATGRQPERVGPAPAELGQLASLSAELAGPGPLALVDIGVDATDVCILQDGHVRRVRTLSLGMGGFPSTAERLATQVRQTLTAFAADVGGEVERVHLVGEGVGVQGLEAFLADRLERPVQPLPELELEFLTAEQNTLVPRFARAIGTAQHVARGRGIDLRQGDLAFQRGFGFLKEKAPLLLGLGAAVIISFVFATWAESRALTREHEVLAAQLEATTKAAFQTATSDPDEATALLEKARKRTAEDPMPYMDGFGVTVALSELIPDTIVHDIEELDFQKGKLRLRGVVNSTDEAQQIAKLIEEHKCFDDAKISKLSQQVNSDREKYVLEANVRCPEDREEKKGKSSGGEQ